MIHLEMQIEELQDELTAIKAINQKLQLEKNALKEQLTLNCVSQQREPLIRFYTETCNKTINRKYAENIVDNYLS